MTKAIDLYINGTEVGDNMEWSCTTEEILGGQGRFTVAVQDRTNSYEPQVHWEVKVVIHSTGWVLGRGEIISQPTQLPVGPTWRTWVFDCADVNNELDWRLVGAVPGDIWIDEDGFGDYVDIDPYANTLADDAQTVTTLFDHYFRFNGAAVDTSGVVAFLTAGGFSPIYWTYTTLKSALDDLAALSTSNVQYWIDPDLIFHWAIIPAWYDLAFGGSPSARGLPSSPTLPGAPMAISDVADGITAIGCRGLSFDFDGSKMPEQVYMNGATGFSYSNGVDPFATGSAAPSPTVVPTYKVTVNSSTNTYRVLSSGYIDNDLPVTTFAAAGGPYDAEVKSFPINPGGEHRGGTFYHLLGGPNAGALLSIHTNALGYGDITAVAIPPTPPPGPPVPIIGVGGSGWVGGVEQDPNKRQAYFDSSQSVDQASRDSIGGQQLYRGSFPTLRGTLTLSGTDGWRVGQQFVLTDVRLPTALNGKTFVIQRVSTSLLPETDIRQYQLDWGDGPVQRASAQPKPRERVGNPAVQVNVTYEDATPPLGSTQTITGQMATSSGVAWKIPGKTVVWVLAVTDAFGDPVAGQGSLDPPVSTTDRNGSARTQLTAGTMFGLTYQIQANVAVT